MQKFAAAWVGDQTENLGGGWPCRAVVLSQKDPLQGSFWTPMPACLPALAWSRRAVPASWCQIWNCAPGFIKQMRPAGFGQAQVGWPLQEHPWLPSPPPRVDPSPSLLFPCGAPCPAEASLSRSLWARGEKLWRRAFWTAPLPPSRAGCPQRHFWGAVEQRGTSLKAPRKWGRGWGAEQENRIH